MRDLCESPSEEDNMQTHLLLGPGRIKGCHCRRFSSAISGDLLSPAFIPVVRDLYHHLRRHRDGRFRCQRSRRKTTTVISAASSSSSSSGSNTGVQDHYLVLGVARNATSVDIKKAYRLLARKVRMFFGIRFSFCSSRGIFTEIFSRFVHRWSD